MPRRIAFPYYGGKNSHLKFLLPLLPKCACYVEPFGGSAAVLLNREPSPVEVYNDLDGECVNFFRVLREQTEELVWALQTTPYSREEFVGAIRGNGGRSPLEKARQFFVSIRQGRGSKPAKTLGDWRFHRLNTRYGRAKEVSAYYGGVGKLTVVAARFMRCQIESAPALEVIRRYDSPEALFYCDPPYPQSVCTGRRGYSHQMTDDDHIDLGVALLKAEGLVAVSSYTSLLYNAIYGGQNPKWYRTFAPSKGLPASDSRRRAAECLYTNYDPRTQ